jgi:hypothetical protein
MSANDDLLVAFELHDPAGIRKSLDAGASPTAPMNGKLPIDWLISMYTRSPNFAASLRAMLAAGASVGNELVEATLLDDDETLRMIVQQDPQRVQKRVTVESAYTSLRGVSALHVCAEFNSVRCAKVLLDAGGDVNDRAEVDGDGLGGQTPLFHTVNSNQNYCRPMMDLLLNAGADVDVRLRGLVWGEGLEWETVVFDITPISYAQCGLYRQFHRDEKDIYDNIESLYRRYVGSPPPRRNVPNRYVFGH